MDMQTKSPMSFHQVRDLVQQELTKLVGRLQIDEDGDYTFTYDSARIFVGVRANELKQGVQSTLVKVFSVTNVDVPVSPELYRHLALRSADYLFGGLCAVEYGTTARVIFRHTLLGDYLDPDEISAAVIMVAFTADDLDDEIMRLFGGRRFTDA